jgi:homoserine O-acetyltransferase/O-succinyltransferase
MKTFRKLFLLAVMLLPMSSSLAFAHGPDQPAHQLADLGELVLEGGGTIKSLRMSYVMHGQLNVAKDNAVLFMTGFSANHHLWDFLIGPGQPLDTDQYCIIASDTLGSTQIGYDHKTLSRFMV